MNDLSVLGFSTQKEDQLRSKVQTVEELARLFPRRYLDMRRGKCLKDVCDGETCAIDGEVIAKDDTGYYPTVFLKDANGDVLEIVWYGNSTYYFKMLLKGHQYRVSGRISRSQRVDKMSNPITFFELGKGSGEILPIHTKIKGMSEKYLSQCIQKAIAYEEAHMIPSAKDMLASRLGIIGEYDALRKLHWPASEDDYKSAKKRMAFDVMYDFYLELKGKRKSIPLNPNLKISTSAKTEAFIKSLPFTLTEGQKKIVDEIFHTTMSGQRLDNLITGDVGSGKTIIAMIAAMLMWENGFQTAIMAPTLVLAKQHYDDMQQKVPASWTNAPKIALLTSETKKRERNKILKGLEDGSISFLIGTSSILSDELDFANLGMTIIDEEHKFGATQKATLEKAKRNGLHHIAMTATPIPRSLARTIYGDNFGILSIETMPVGRKPVITEQGSHQESMFEKLAQEVMKGHQAYVICPFISDSDSEQFADVDSVETTTANLMKYYRSRYPQIRVDSINGKMRQSAVLKKIEEFQNHNIDILVSTTIVEVGVNVPNATAMLIMSAERFGLAALHQLRGRVGRSSIQSYCYLYTKKYSEKLDILCHTMNGFLIAEEDMKLRGPGNLAGEEQTGYSEAIETIIRRPKLANKVRTAIFE